MAERAGFEPAVEFDPYDGLANRSFRPLRHLSAYQNWITILHYSVFSTAGMRFFGKFQTSLENSPFCPVFGLLWSKWNSVLYRIKVTEWQRVAIFFEQV